PRKGRRGSATRNTRSAGRASSTPAPRGGSSCRSTGAEPARDGLATRRSDMSAMKEFLSNSYLFGANAPFIEELYEAYLDDPQSVPEQWREYFDRLQRLPAGANAGSGARDVAHAPIVESYARRARPGAARAAPAVA